MQMKRVFAPAIIASVLAAPLLAQDGTMLVLEAPTKAHAGGELSIHWQGPNFQSEHISIADIGTKAFTYEIRLRAEAGALATLKAPAKAGIDALRYGLGVTNISNGVEVAHATQPIEVTE